MVLAGLFCFHQPANASISFILTAGELRTAGGSSLLPTDALVLLVASTQGVSLNPADSPLKPGAINPGDVIGASGNRVVWRGNLAFEPGVLFNSTGALDLGDFPGWTQGDALALYWFPALTTTDTQISLGDSYGVFWGQGVTSDGGGEPWVTPLDGTSGYEMNFWTLSFPYGSGSNPNPLGFASLVVIPEPRIGELLAVGFALFGLRRLLFASPQTPFKW